MKFCIGISTYGPIPRAESLIRSLKQNMDEEYRNSPPHIILCDDGTPKNLLGPRKLFCEREGVNLILHGENRGIPSVWGTICKNSPPDTEAILILSDGVRFVMPNFLTTLAYFLDRNKSVGTVGLPLLHRNIDNGMFDPNDSRWDSPAGRVGAAVGCCFAFRPALADRIVNPDGSVGFWHDLRSFHEEIHFGFKLAEIGYPSFMIPWVPVSYMGGMAFGAHPELTWREPSPYLPMAEFLHYARMSRWYVPEYEEKYAENRVDRMTYSRGQFCKYWGIFAEVDAGRRIQVIKDQEVDVLDNPQIFAHRLAVDPLPLQKIFWLDKNLQEQSGII